MSYEELVKALDAVLWEAELNPFKLIAVSDGAERILGARPADLIANPEKWRSSVFNHEGKTLQDVLDSVTPEKNSFSQVYKLTRPGGEIVWLRDIVTVQFKKKKPVRMTGLTVDVTESKELEQALQLVIDIGTEAVEADTVEGLSALCLEKICKSRNWRVGQAWFLNDEVNSLVCSTSAFYSEIPVEDFRRISLMTPMVRGRGLPGAVWDTNKPLWLADVSKCENFPRIESAVQSGIKSAFAFPIHHGDKLYGVFEFFDKHIREPDQAFISSVEQLGTHLSGVFERMLAERRLTRQREEQRTIFDSVPALIWYKDRNNRILRANKPACDAAGLSVTAIAGKSTYDLYPLEAEKYFQDDLDVINSGKPKLGIVEPLRLPSGETRWIATDKIPYLDHDGNILGVIVFSQDITERKLAEDQLLSAHADLEHKVQERTKELQEAHVYFKLTRELFAIAGFDGYFKRLNPIWEEVLGYTMDELLQIPFLELIHPEDREKSQGELSRLSRGERVEFFENRYIAKDGSFKHLLWSASSDLPNQIINAVAHDVTARREAELELQDISARIANLARHVPGVIYQFSLAKEGTMGFTYISQSSRQILGYEPRELESDVNLVLSMVHPDDRASLQRSISESNASLSTFKFEGRLIARSGTTKWIRASSTPEVLPNGDTLWNGLMMDITDLKAAEEKVRQLNEDLAQRVSILAAVNQELEILTHKLELAYDEALEASKLKSEFVANISHEVRTPISAVLGMSELLLDTPLNHEQQSFVRIVSESAQSLLTIINDILDFSKMEAGRLELEVIDLSVLSLVEGCADWLASAARRKRLELMTYSDPSIPVHVKGDPVRLRQVLLNLTSNAIKFTERGEVVVRATKFREKQDKIVLLFQVTDTGIGLSDPARKRLFQPFAQADGSTTRKYGGTGLGLSISKRLVELMGGEIGVHSVEGKGSTFWFTVPLSHERSTEPSEPSFENGELPKNVLIVDASKTSEEIITSYLKSAGVQSIVAIEPTDCENTMRSMASQNKKFDYSIVDVTTDSVEAFRIAQQLMAKFRDTSGKVIVIAPFDEREGIEQAHSAGVFACLSKPLRRAHLLDTILRPQKKAVEVEEAIREINPALILARQTNFKPEKEKQDEEYSVLLAEDNPVLQQLALKQLQKFGLSVTVVSNGKEALDRALSRNFALIFMDCQMPKMDGYEATLAIREQESRSGNHIPIIAMTASAMPSDRERCLASGMDDYLSKPVSQAHLRRILDTWLPEKSQPDLEAREETIMEPDDDKVSTDDSVGPVNINELSRIYGEEDLIDILKMFLVEAEDLLKSIETQLEAKNDRELANLAHQLKGLSAVLCANDLTRYSLQLEQASKRSSWEPAQSALKSLTSEFKEVSSFVNSYLDSRGIS